MPARVPRRPWQQPALAAVRARKKGAPGAARHGGRAGGAARRWEGLGRREQQRPWSSARRPWRACCCCSGKEGGSEGNGGDEWGMTRGLPRRPHPRGEGSSTRRGGGGAAAAWVPRAAHASSMQTFRRARGERRCGRLGGRFWATSGLNQLGALLTKLLIS
jgi:hypothetical protein